MTIPWSNLIDENLGGQNFIDDNDRPENFIDGIRQIYQNTQKFLENKIFANFGVNWLYRDIMIPIIIGQSDGCVGTIWPFFSLVLCVLSENRSVRRTTRS